LRIGFRVKRTSNFKVKCPQLLTFSPSLEGGHSIPLFPFIIGNTLCYGYFAHYRLAITNCRRKHKPQLSALLSYTFLDSLDVAAAHALDFTSELKVAADTVVVKNAETVNDRAGLTHRLDYLVWIKIEIL